MMARSVTKSLPLRLIYMRLFTCTGTGLTKTWINGGKDCNSAIRTLSSEIFMLRWGETYRMLLKMKCFAEHHQIKSRFYKNSLFFFQGARINKATMIRGVLFARPESQQAARTGVGLTCPQIWFAGDCFGEGVTISEKCGSLLSSVPHTQLVYQLVDEAAWSV